jgi:uncharacterized protein (TIGR03435 family)
MRNLPRAFLACLLFAAAAPAQTDVSGKWSGIGGGPIYMVLKQEGNKLSGTAGPSAKEQLLEFHDGTVEGDHLLFKVGPLEIDARMEGDEIHGQAVLGGQASKVILKRADKLDPDARFEVASVKPAPPTPGRGISSNMRMDPSRITCTNVTLKKLIVESYEMKEYQVIGPEWLNTELYNIEATIAPGTSGDQALVMIHNLLADRFHLALHRETRELSVYALVVGKNGSKLHASELPRSSTSSRPGKITGQGTFMRNLVEALSRQLDLPVIDMTGLKGTFDFTLEWAPDRGPSAEPRGAPAPTEAAAGPSIFTAVQEQLGLKLEARKAPVEILVVDHAEKTPTGN